MSDKNIDKDIEILKRFTEVVFIMTDRQEITKNAHKEISLSIENVLSEIEELKDDLRIHEETSFDFQKENIELREEIKERHIKHIALAIENEDLEKELETYKKANDNLLVKNAELRVELETYKKIINTTINYVLNNTHIEHDGDDYGYTEWIEIDTDTTTFITTLKNILENEVLKDE